MGELLLELLSEEIPARMQRRAMADLIQLLRDKLIAAEIPAADMRGYVTPRRLVVIGEDIPATQPDRTEERRGPRVGAPPAAIEGFLRAVGLASIEECELRDTGRGGFYFAVLGRAGRPSAEVLPELIAAAIAELAWQKSMRWPGAALRWVRPLTSIVCLYEGAVVPLAIEGVPVGRATRGHRFLSPGDFCADSAAEYLEKLQHAYVIVDQDRRKEIIRGDLDRQAAEIGVAVKPDPGLLDEVTGLAEFPVVLAGAIDPDFMTLPSEVLQTAMRTHQKYFSCLYPDGEPAPHFLFVANNLAEDGGAAIVAGNERVLRARLADARFFWDQDRKVRLEDRVEALKDRLYHDKLGSMYDKVQRMETLAAFLAQFVSDARLESAPHAARLAKADLSTGLVGEFPELQGIMGRYYALHDGEDVHVAAAVAEHYRPLGPNDACPVAALSVITALADKIDTLVSFFAIGERPTGSRDPFALRRAAQGVIRLILENNLRLPLSRVFESAAVRLPRPIIFSNGTDPWDSSVPVVCTQLLAFVVERLRVHLREQGIRHDIISAALARAGQREDDLVRLRYRVEVLRDFVGSEVGANLLIAYRRAANIVTIEERNDGCKHAGEIDPAFLQQPEEQALFDLFNKIGETAQTEIGRDVLETAIVQLARLRPSVDAFFDKVTVNTDDAKLRENRLRLLARIRDTMNRVADFSQIEG